MNWFKIAQDNISNKVKSILKKHTFTQKLLKDYNIPIEDIDNHLTIEITELDGKFAEGNGKTIYLDKKLFEDDFFHDNFHFVIHEFFHWIKRRSEKEFYFNDPEEVQSFVLAIAWQLINKKDKEQIESSIYPIIKNQYKDKYKSKEVFDDMFKEAVKLYKLYTKI